MHDQTLLSILPHSSSVLHQTEQFFSLSNIISDSSSMLKMLRVPHEELRLVQSFQTNNAVAPIPPFQEAVLTSDEAAHLRHLYQQLYSQKGVIVNFTHYIALFGKVLYAGDLIGSVKPGTNNSLSSIIMANWSAMGDFSTPSTRVGEVQYFFKHTVTFELNGSKESMEHVLYWKKLHPKEDWYGISATVCTDLYQLNNSSSFLAVQRIACRCAHAILNVKFDTHAESVFVACPIAIKFCF